jgi:hypothetical protein
MASHIAWGMGHGAAWYMYMAGGGALPKKKREEKTENQARGARHRLLSAVLFRPLPAAAAGF